MSAHTANPNDGLTKAAFDALGWPVLIAGCSRKGWKSHESRGSLAAARSARGNTDVEPPVKDEVGGIGGMIDLVRSARKMLLPNMNHIIPQSIADKAAGNRRAYSGPKVIHERRGVIPFHTPQAIVNNFGGVKFFFGEQPSVVSLK